MSPETDTPGWHMRPPRQPYVEELHRENEHLRAQVSSLEQENEAQRVEKKKFEEQLSAAHQAVARRQGQEDLLGLQLDDTIEKNRQLTDRCAMVEHKCIDFAHLLAASYRLQKAWDRTAVTRGLQEILVNLVGCEELAIFECVAGSQEVLQLSSLGRPPLSGVYTAGGLLAEALLRRQVVFAEGGEEEDQGAQPSVCFPLLVEDRALGLVVLYRLLPQKLERLTGLDGELLDLLMWQGGRALHGAIQKDGMMGSRPPVQERSR